MTDQPIKPITLKQNVHGCLEELENCANGLVYFDHLYGQLLDALDEAEATYDSYEATAAQEVRDSLDKGATATDLKAGISRWMERRPEARKALDNLREKRRQKAKVERWMRSLEKRIGAAQSARSGHEDLNRGAGRG